MIAEFLLQLLNVEIPADAGAKIMEGFDEAIRSSPCSITEAYIIVRKRLKQEARPPGHSSHQPRQCQGGQHPEDGER